MAIYLRSFVWLIGISTLGYVLMQVVTPNEDDIRKKLGNDFAARTEAEKKRQQFSAILLGAVENPKPLYKPFKQDSDTKDSK